MLDIVNKVVNLYVDIFVHVFIFSARKRPYESDMKLGLHRNLPNADYHASGGVSKTKLDMFVKDECAIEWVRDCPVDDEKLKTLDFGDAAHAIVLEPDRLSMDFVVAPEVDMRTNAGKNEMRQFKAENQDRKIITAEEYRKLELMRDSVFAHPGCRKWLNMRGEAEQSWYWIDPTTGLKCKCRPDRNVFGSPFIIDVKTTDSLDKFRFSVEDYRYDVGAPFYTDGMTACGEEKSTMIFLVIQKTIELGRYPVRLVHLPEEVVEYGRRTYQADLIRYAEAKSRGFSKAVCELQMSDRYMRKLKGNMYD